MAKLQLAAGFNTPSARANTWGVIKKTAQPASVQHQQRAEPIVEYRKQEATEVVGSSGRVASFGERREPALGRHVTRRRGRGVRFQGVSSESASREGSLRKSGEADSI